jgi:hypothetical protein
LLKFRFADDTSFNYFLFQGKIKANEHFKKIKIVRLGSFLFFSFIFLYFLSFKRYLLEHLRVSKFTKENLLQVSAISHLGLPDIKNQPLAILVKKNGSDC